MLFYRQSSFHGYCLSMGKYEQFIIKLLVFAIVSETYEPLCNMTNKDYALNSCTELMY